MKRVSYVFLLILGIFLLSADKTSAGFVSVSGPDYDGFSYTYDVLLDAPTVNEGFLCITWNENPLDTTPPFPADNMNLCEPLNGDPFALQYSCTVNEVIPNGFVFDIFDPANGAPPLLVPGCDNITYWNLIEGLLDTDAYNLGITYQDTGPTAITLQSIKSLTSSQTPTIVIIGFLFLALSSLYVVHLKTKSRW